MKTSAFLATTGALLAAAGPIKRAYETEWVTDYVTVCVTEGQQQAAQPTSVSYAAPAQPDTEDTNAYTTVWVQSEPETTQAPEQYTTWYTTTTWGNSGEQASSAYEAPKVSTSVYEAPKESTSTSAAPAQSTGNIFSLDGDYSVVMTQYHNNHRRNHTVDDVAWHSGLASAAAEVAATCTFAHDMTKLVDGKKVTYGQNIASWGSTDAPTGAANTYGALSITNQWYNSEVMNYKGYYGDANPPSGLDLDAYGHFTQVVWKETTHVGCATQYCGSGEMYSFPAYYTVCNYLSAGNYGGEYGTNVCDSDGSVPFHEVSA